MTVWERFLAWEEAGLNQSAAAKEARPEPLDVEVVGLWYSDVAVCECIVCNQLQDAIRAHEVSSEPHLVLRFVRGAPGSAYKT